MNTPARLLLLGALGLALGACDNKGEPAGSTSGQTANHDGHDHAGGNAHAGNTAPAKPAEPAEPKWTQETSEGTLRLFLGAMAEGRFGDAVVLIDEGSESYEDFLKLHEAFDPATANPNMSKAQLEMVKGLFSSPWKDATAVLVSEEPNRAEYTVTLASGNEKTIALNQFDGNWFVLATRTLLNPGRPEEPQGDAPGQPAGSSGGQ